MEKIEHKLINADIDEIVKILNYYQDEWKFRQTHFWNLAIKMFTLNLIITMLPFVSSIGGMAIISRIPPYAFLIAAIIISLIELFVLLAEGIRHIDISQTRSRINNMLPAPYRYYENEADEKRKSDYDRLIKKIFKTEKHMPESIPWVMFLLQMLLEFFVAVVLILCADGTMLSKSLIGFMALIITGLSAAALHRLRKD